MIERFKLLLKASHSAVIFTGAGISTESGIPDFRSPGGLWSRMAPIDFQDFMREESMRVESWRRKFAMAEELGVVKPNKGHDAVATLVAQGHVSHVITQNIDNLHQESGIPLARIIELHGNGSYGVCLSCERRCELAAIRTAFMKNGKAPLCADCGGIVKSGTVSFGQAMPEEEMRRAHEATQACDLFMAIGSSLQVYPAAGFPLLAKRNGASLVILNREPTPIDDLADLVLHEEIGDTLAGLV